MRKTLIIIGVIVLTIFLIYTLFFKRAEGPTARTTNESVSYAEYPFDSGDDNDLGFTRRALEHLQKDAPLLDDGGEAVKDQVLVFVRLAENDLIRGVVERRMWGNDIYELIHNPRSGISGAYRMMKNGQLLFEEQMDYGAEGPILDWRIVNNKPAFTFITACASGEDRRVTCEADIWYDGGFISKKFNVKNPRYLFGYSNTVGFVATDNSGDRIFYDDIFITQGFSTIWTHNCCSFTEILPTIYENSALLFYAKRDEMNYLVEIKLSSQASKLE